MNDLDRLWDDVPVGTPDLSAALRGGTRLRRRRQSVGAVVATAVLVVGIGSASALGPRAGEAPLPLAPDRSTATTEGDGTATLFYLLDEPVPEGAPFEQATLLTPREVEVKDTGRPGYDALHALLTLEPPSQGLSVGFNFVGDDPVTDVESVTHEDGVVSVDLSGSPWDPYPAYDLCCTPDGLAVTQQLVHTVQAALGTSDPVELAGRGIWFEELDGPVEADPDVVVPSADPVALATFPAADGHVQPFVGGRVELRGDGCVTLDGVPTVWPDGWTAWRAAGQLVLLDPDGRLAVRGGDRIGASGGVSRRIKIAGPCLEEGQPAAGILGDVGVTSP